MSRCCRNSASTKRQSSRFRPTETCSLDEVLALHEDQVERYGGATGTRDIGLLQFAIGGAAPTYGGAFLHETLFEMAAALLHGICRNHPFVDGNKRTTVATSLTFLDINGIEIDADDDDFHDLVIGVAEERVSKSSVAVFLTTTATRRPPR